jgi:hypothetical protein
MENKYHNVKKALDIVREFAETNKLELKVYGAPIAEEPHIVLSRGDFQVVTFYIKPVKGLSFRGISDKVKLYESEMFDYFGYGTYDVETKRGQEKLKAFLSGRAGELNDYLSLFSGARSSCATSKCKRAP